MNIEHDHPRRARFDAVVRINRAICREHYLLRLGVPRNFPATEPGQFIQLGCRTPNGALPSEQLHGAEHDWQPGKKLELQQVELVQPTALLRRPFSLAGHGADASGGPWIEIVHRVVGVGTRWLEQLKVGDAVDLIGPLGNAFTLPEGKSLGLLVGGGVGLPPMFYLAQALKTRAWDATAFVGALTADLLAVDWNRGAEVDIHGKPTPAVRQFAELGYPTVVTTNDGSRGMRALITTGLEHYLQGLGPADLRRAVVFTCGPEKMMHAVAQLAEKFGIPCQVCMEQAMACGMGTCQSCVVKIDPRKIARFKDEPAQGTSKSGQPWRYKLACTDGPVFDAQAVVW